MVLPVPYHPHWTPAMTAFEILSALMLSASGTKIPVQSCRHGGALVGLASTNKAPSPPKLKFEIL